VPGRHDGVVPSPRARLTLSSALVAALVGVGSVAAGGSADAQAPADLGSFSAPFVEPTIEGKPTTQRCVPKAKPAFDRELACKPTAGSLNTLPGGDIFYWDALAGTENVNNSIVAEYGRASENDQSRLLQLGAGDSPSFTEPQSSDGGANPNGEPNTVPLIPGTATSEPGNDGALFCADQNFLADGRIIAAGGTDYLNDPGVEGAPAGVTELAGVTSTRIYNPATRSWSQTGRMNQGRWYPALVTMGDGRIFTASGVEKLIKPAYPNDPAASGGNVRETEIFTPQTGKWTQNPVSANRSLPLFPRLHLLPDGKVYFNAAGQAFNPAGEDYAEAQWNVASAYDPAKQTWTELGVPGATTGVTTAPGFRGSTSSTMLPLKPNADGSYTKASFLTAGGVLNPPSPGGYLAVAQSQIATVDTAAADKLTTEETGPLSQGRWYGSQVLMPTGEVITFSGSDRDEVVAPGTEVPIKRAEQFDPVTKKWTPLASANRVRTYHNTAVLMPDGRVMIGGHATISALYGKNMTVADGVTGPNDGRDPTFEIFTPPALQRGARPTIEAVAAGGAKPDPCPGAPVAARTGSSLDVFTGDDAGDIENAVLVRYPTQTHVVDGDQRTVELRVTSRDAKHLQLAMPASGNVLPPGPYMLFVNRRSAKGLIPSVARTVFVDAPVPEHLACKGTGPTACASKNAFPRASAAPRGHGLAVGFKTREPGAVDVDVFQHSEGRRVVRERLVARFGSKRAAFRWDGRRTRPGRKAGDGFYSVRFLQRTSTGKREFRRIALQRVGGRFIRRSDFYLRALCGPVSAFKLERPAFGGRSSRPLRIAYRLATQGRVSVSVLRGSRTVQSFPAVARPGQRTFRLAFGAGGRPRGDYRVRLTVVTPSGRRLTTTLTARRL
jgi:hypothetical protein